MEEKRGEEKVARRIRRRKVKGRRENRKEEKSKKGMEKEKWEGERKRKWQRETANDQNVHLVFDFVYIGKRRQCWKIK